MVETNAEKSTRLHKERHSIHAISGEAEKAPDSVSEIILGDLREAVDNLEKTIGEQAEMTHIGLTEVWHLLSDLSRTATLLNRRGEPYQSEELVKLLAVIMTRVGNLCLDARCIIDGLHRESR